MVLLLAESISESFPSHKLMGERRREWTQFSIVSDSSRPTPLRSRIPHLDPFTTLINGIPLTKTPDTSHRIVSVHSTSLLTCNNSSPLDKLFTIHTQLTHCSCPCVLWINTHLRWRWILWRGQESKLQWYVRQSFIRVRQGGVWISLAQCLERDDSIFHDYGGEG